MLPAYPAIPILDSSPFLLLLGQGAVATVRHADAAVIASIVKGYLVFVFCADEPPNLDGRLRRAKRLCQLEGTAQFAD